MRALLDPHVFLGWLAEPERLSNLALDVLSDKSHELFFSAASAWEIAMKTLLVAQARMEKLPILTSDAMIAVYGVQVIW